MSTKKQMADHFRKLMTHSFREVFSPLPVVNLLIGPLAAGAGLLLLRSSVFAGEAPEWLFSKGLTFAVIALSCVSILLAATKSLFPALLLLFGTFVALAIGSPTAICSALTVSSFVCAMTFQVGHQRH